MRRILSLALFAGLWFAPAISNAQNTPMPPPTQAPAAPPTQAPETAASPITITLGAKSETITPGKIHDGLAKDGKITVATPKPDTMSILISGVAAAHTFLGFHSVAIYSFRVTQEFEVSSSDPNVSQAVLNLESTLNGYVRTKGTGTARLSLATATLAPVGGAPILAISYPTSAFAGGNNSRKYEQEIKPPAQGPLPLGRYVLAATFQVEASADGIGCSRGVADFSADALPDPWKQEKDPYKDVDRANFGFSTTVTALVPGASVQARKSKRESASKPRVARATYTRPGVTSISSFSTSSAGRSLAR